MIMKKFRSMLAFLLSVLMIMTMVPSMAWAQGAGGVDEDAGGSSLLAAGSTMPGAVFTGEANGLQVEVTADEGTFPAGTTMTVTAVNNGAVRDSVTEVVGEDAGNIVAVDITFYDADGNEIEPLQEVHVAFGNILLGSACSIVHIDSDGQAEKLAGVSYDRDGRKASLESDQFSVYAVVEEGSTGDNARATVNFYGWDSDKESVSKLVATYYVKNSDTADELLQIVSDPGAGTLDTGYIFHGWSIDAAGANADTDYDTANYGDDYSTTTKPYTIEGIRTYLEGLTIKEGDEIDVYGMIFKMFTVTYLDDDGVSLGTDSVLLTSSENTKDYTVSMVYTADSTHDFEGWIVSSGRECITSASSGAGTEVSPYVNGTVLTLNGSTAGSGITLVVSCPEGRWLVFDEVLNGATYISPQFVKSSEVTQEPDIEMHCYGYTFDGWYTDKEYTTKFVFGQALTGYTTIYAKWNANSTAPFTVLIWKQNTSRDGYDFYASYSGTGNVGSSIVSTAITTGTTGDLTYATIGGTKYGGITSVSSGTTSDPLTGFTLSSTAIKDANITLDGKAVVNVYFDRMQYTLKMYVTRTNSNGDGNYYGSSRGSDSQYRGNWDTSLNGITSVKGSAPTTYDTVSNNRYYYYSITAYYGTSISSSWPAYDEITVNRTGYSFISWILMTSAKAYTGSDAGQDTVKGTISVMDENVLGNLSDADGNYVTARYSNQYRNWIYYIYLADSDGNYSSNPDQTLYLRSADGAGNNTSDVGTKQHAPAIDGYEFDSASSSGSADYNSETISGTTYYTKTYKYTPKKYNILFMDGQYVDGDGNPVQNYSGSTLGEKTNIVLGSDTSDCNDYTPVLPSTEKGYVFDGWYIDSACSQPYTFTTMPEGGIIVYARWVKIQYRIFLHAQTNDESVYWGSNSQAMSFRRSYGDKISAPTGTRVGYELVGWYLDADYSIPFSYDAYTLNETTVTTNYDYNTEYTDVMDKFGNIVANGATYWDIDNTLKTNDTDPYNTDKNKERFWITKKLDLYARWRATLVGANGINVVYNANDTEKSINGENAPTDSTLYLDSSDAIAQAASTPDYTDTYQFLYWVVQTWDSTANDGKGGYVDTNEIVFPGDTYTVYKANAKITNNSDGSVVDEDEVVSSGSYTYTVQLRASYGTKETPTPTYINWYRNWTAVDTTTTGLLHNDADLQINEAVTIYTLGDGASIPTRAGYTFLGWAREPEYTNLDVDYALTDNSVARAYVDDLDEDDLYLKWDSANNQYLAKNSSNSWVKVTEVAADERMPYHAMYAVWGNPYFYVYHSGLASSASGVVETIQMDNTTDSRWSRTDASADRTFNLTGSLTDNTLYGGYYDAFDIVPTDMDDLDGVKDITIPVDDDAVDAYNGDNWTWDKFKMGTVAGTAITPKAGHTYFIKEVPESYLAAKAFTYYGLESKVIYQMYMLTGTDDDNYTAVGFEGSDIAKKTAAGTLKVTIAYLVENGSDTQFKYDASASNLELTSKKVLGSGFDKDYLWVAQLTSGYSDSASKLTGKTIQYVPYWVTPDALKVLPASGKTVTSTDGKYATGDGGIFKTYDITSDRLSVLAAGSEAVREMRVVDNIVLGVDDLDSLLEEETEEVASVAMHRLYNPNSGEHFYTASVEERDSLIEAGWNYEDIAWYVPEVSDTPVYRLYNANAGDHHYTIDTAERDALIEAGWTDEGIGWYSDDAQSVPLYRLYNPNAYANGESGAHHYTTSEEELAGLVDLGWQNEGIAWYGLEVNA